MAVLSFSGGFAYPSYIRPTGARILAINAPGDQRVPISQYELLKKNLEKAGRPPEVTIVEDKEGHGFYDYDNQVELYTAMQAFLDKYIGAGAKPAPAAP